ncbi:hypothetical protein NXW50_13750 [Bacteroides thetaiotaomicron]|nr:hypothetical protein [Bacteroides thetaiotaomicron]MCS2279211.1 hypothetical protein [Bacteroides thetaiotaomicron]
MSSGLPCGTPSFSTLPNHPAREYPFPVPEESTDRKRHHPTGEIQALKRNIFSPQVARRMLNRHQECILPSAARRAAEP